MSDAQVLAKLRAIVTIGNPDRKYKKVEKIGSGYVTWFLPFLIMSV